MDLGYLEPGMKAGVPFRRMGMDFSRTPARADTEAQYMTMTIATWDAMTVAAELNKEAARWTAASVCFSTLTSIIGALA